MIGFQIFIGDSTYFRILGLERLRDNHLATREDGNNALFVNQYALQALGIAEDATNFKVGENYTYNYDIAGVYRDFQLGSALDELQPVLLKYYDSPEEFLKRRIPGISWSKSTGTKPRPTIRSNRYSNVFPTVRSLPGRSISSRKSKPTMPSSGASCTSSVSSRSWRS